MLTLAPGGFCRFVGLLCPCSRSHWQWRGLHARDDSYALCFTRPT